MEGLQWVGRVVLVALALLPPGLAWSYVFLKDEVSWGGRLAISLGLSLVLLPLSLLWLSVTIGVPATSLNLGLVAAGLALAPIVWRGWQRWQTGKNAAAPLNRRGDQSSSPGP